MEAGSYFFSSDFSEVHQSDDPLIIWNQERNYYFKHPLGDTIGFIINSGAIGYNISMPGVPLISGNKYVLSFVMKRIKRSASTHPSNVICRVRNINTSIDISPLTSFFVGDKSDMVFNYVFIADDSMVGATLNVYLNVSSDFDNSVAIADIAIHNYNSIKTIYVHPNAFATDPTATNLPEGYSFLNTTSGKMKRWKNGAFTVFD